MSSFEEDFTNKLAKVTGRRAANQESRAPAMDEYSPTREALRRAENKRLAALARSADPDTPRGGSHRNAGADASLATNENFQHDTFEPNKTDSFNGLNGNATRDFDESAEDNARQPQLDPTPFVLRPAEAILRRPKLLGSHFIRKFVSSTMGRTGVGKTDYLIVDILSMVTARLLLDYAPATPLNVWYIGEDPVDEMERRIVAACQHYGITAAQIGDRLHVDSALVLNDLKIARSTARGGTIIDTAVQDRLMAAITRRKLDVLILDPLIKFHLVNESNPTDMDFVMRGLGESADKTNIAVELGHHLRKSGAGYTGPATMDDGRGASSIISAARSVRMMNTMSSAEATKAAIAEADRWRYLRVDSAPLGKDNMSVPEATRWFQHTSEMLPCGESIGVITAWKFPDAMEGVTAADMYKARDLARGGDYRSNERAKNWFGRAIAEHMRLDLESPTDKQKIKVLIKTWMRNKVLDIENREDLTTRKKFDFVIPGPFKDGPQHTVANGPSSASGDNEEF
jgi:hypothetical protein